MGAEYTLDKSSAGSSKGAFIWQEGDFFITEDDYDEPKFENNHTYVAEYPSEIFNDSIWKTEQTYDETDIYIPMFGEAKCTEDGAADFTFTNLGGLLRLNVKGTATIKSITVRAKEPMSGHILDIFCEDDEGYKVAFISDWAILFTPDTKNYINLDCGKNGVKLSPEGTDFYISMPCRYNAKGEEMADFDGYTDVTITLKDTDGKTCVKKLNNKKLFIERSQITTATFTASEFKANVPEGALPGKFSVSADKQVYFSQGNLTATVDAAGKPTAWKFAANQYDYLGEGGANKTIGTAVGDVDLFGWSTNAIKYGISTSTNENDYSGDFVDWGKNIGDGSTWRTLSKDEWVYLFETRTNASSLYKYGVTVCGKTNCVVIAPDGFTGTIETSYDATAWAIAEAAGLVCLPAAGRRYGPNVSYVGDDGIYWSSTANVSSLAYFVYFYSSDVLPDYYDYRYSGFSVRLITESK